MKHSAKISVWAKTLALAFTLITGAYGTWHIVKAYRVKNLGGHWKVNCFIKSSSYIPYRGKTAGYRIYLSQDGTKITGKGEMCWIDDKDLAANEHIPLTLEGIIEGKQIKLNYTQTGALRTTFGEMNLMISDETILEGTFTGTAANSAGSVMAVKIEDY